MMDAIDNKEEDNAVYLTYDEKVVRRATINRAVQTLGSTHYWTYDERSISRIEIMRGIRASSRRRRLPPLLGTTAIVLTVVLAFVLMIWIGSHAPRPSMIHSMLLTIAVPVLLLVGFIWLGRTRASR